MTWTPESPAARGYRMPAEWEPHRATWLAWPRDPLTWINGVDRAENVFVAMVRALSAGEVVELLVHDEATRERVAERLAEEGIANTRLHVAGHVDSWVRDYGPTFLVNDTTGERLGVDWTFNAWGDKYETLKQDDRLGAFICEAAGVEHLRVDAVMEGGSIEVNGRGTVLTTEQCLLNANRNPSMDRAAIEQLLLDHLGATKVLWLADGIEGDDTDGHVDDLTRFVGPRTVVTAVEEDERSPNHAPLRENRKRLASMTDQDGRPLEVVELPMPAYEDDDEGALPASYANFLIGNEAVLLPVFDDANDARAQRILEELFPDRRVVPIVSNDLIVGMGSCHCLSQQEPR